jgi:hypothetical protein
MVEVAIHKQQVEVNDEIDDFHFVVVIDLLVDVVVLS